MRRRGAGRDLDAALEVCRLWAQDLCSGMIFHRPVRSSSTWFAAIWLVTSQKNGASGVKQPARHAGPGSDEVLPAWLHKLRRRGAAAWTASCWRVVEVDEAFIGGRANWGRRAPQMEKVPS